MPYIYFGGGSAAQELYNKICKSDGRDIDIEAFVLNDDYYDETGLQMMLDIPVIPMREVNLDDPKVFLCMGYSHYNFFDTEIIPPKMKGKFLSEDVTVFMDTSGKKNVLDYEFVKDKWSEFEKVYNILEDEKSKRVLAAYLNQRISWETYVSGKRMGRKSIF